MKEMVVLVEAVIGMQVEDRHGMMEEDIGAELLLTIALAGETVLPSTVTELQVFLCLWWWQKFQKPKKRTTSLAEPANRFV